MRKSFSWEGKEGMVYSICRYTRGCAGKTVKSLDSACHTRSLLQRGSFTEGRTIESMTFIFTFYLYLPEAKAGRQAAKACAKVYEFELESNFGYSLF